MIFYMTMPLYRAFIYVDQSGMNACKLAIASTANKENGQIDGKALLANNKSVV